MKILDNVPNGHTLKSRTMFSKADVIQIALVQNTQIEQMQTLVSYEQGKVKQYQA